MSELRALLMRLDDDVKGLPLPDAAALRRWAQRPRRRWWLVPAAAASAAAVGVTVVVVGGPRGNDTLQQGSDPASLRGTPSPSTAQGPEAEPAWLPRPWTISSTRSTPVGSSRPEYLFCGWPVPPSQVINGERTTVSEQVLVHPAGLRARLIKYETDTPGGLSNLFKLSFDSCLAPGGAEGFGGPRNVWVYRGVAGGSDFAAAGVVGGSDLSSTRAGVSAAIAQEMHVVEISSQSEARPPTRYDAAAALGAWALST